MADTSPWLVGNSDSLTVNCVPVKGSSCKRKTPLRPVTKHGLVGSQPHARAPSARAMADSEDDDFAEQSDRSTVLRQNFASAVAAVLDEAEEANARLPASAGFAAQLAEVAWTWTTTALAPDLEAFARHAKRARIGVEDVLLAARKNEATAQLMEREAAKLRSVKRKAGDGDKSAREAAAQAE